MLLAGRVGKGYDAGPQGWANARFVGARAQGGMRGRGGALTEAKELLGLWKHPTGQTSGYEV
jgi:hypothetical protein